MAIVKVSGSSSGLERRLGLKAAGEAAKKAAKKGAKHAIEKYAAKKAAKKTAEKAAKKAASKPKHGVSSSDGKAGQSELLCRAFHHLQRAGALISLLEPASGGDLKQLLEYGTELYRAAATPGAGAGQRDLVQCAAGLLRAAEHLAMAGLCSARTEFRVRVPAPDPGEVRLHLRTLAPRLERLSEPSSGQAQRLLRMARELLRRAQESDGKNPHLEFEQTMAAEGLCTALERGL